MDASSFLTLQNTKGRLVLMQCTWEVLAWI